MLVWHLLETQTALVLKGCAAVYLMPGLPCHCAPWSLKYHVDLLAVHCGTALHLFH